LGFKAHPSVIRKVYEYIPLPSLQEQNAIVEKLDAAFVSLAEMESSLRAETKLLLEVLDSQHRTHFFENGNNWPVSTIGELCEYQNGKAHEQLVTVNGKFRLVTSKFVSTDGTQARRVSRALSPLSRGDVAFVLSDLPNGKALAKAFLVTEEEDLTLNQRVLRIRSKDLDPKFLYLQVNRNPHLLAFDNGESQTHLKLAQALSCPLLVPDMKIQTEISEHFFVLRASIHESLSVQELKLARIKELREAILSSFLCEESNVA
jgi:restriction endonuclease S subunit